MEERETCSNSDKPTRLSKPKSAYTIESLLGTRCTDDDASGKDCGDGKQQGKLV